MTILPRQLVATVDGERLLRGLDELAAFGADDRGGVTRPGLSAAEHEARQHLIQVAFAAGLGPSMDQAGNLIIRRRAASDRPVLLMGSHLDSVVHGGRLDGAYGVVAAIEALQVIDESGLPLRHEPVAVAFANEEGALLGPPFWGSLALTGQLDLRMAETGRVGGSLREALSAAGGDLDAIGSAAWPAGSIGAYLELHIEQGPVLEHHDLPIGVVDAIIGRTLFHVCVRGEQGHAGTTPMELRRDALAAAARLVIAVEELAATRRLCQVATVGQLGPDPNVANVIPGLVHLTAEIRDQSTGRLAAAETALRQAVADIARATGTAIDVDVRMRIPPTGVDPGLRAAIVEAAGELGLRHQVMPSGAGHDAQIVAEVAPIGMIFVPSRGGVSHTPAEYTDDQRLIDGANVLLNTAVRL